MNTNIIKDILNLKEHEGHNIFELFLTKSENSVKLGWNGDANFKEIYWGQLESLFNLSKQILDLYHEEILNSLEEHEAVPMLRVTILVDKGENTVSIYLPFVKIYKEGSEKAVEEIMENARELMTEMDKILNLMIDKYLEIEEKLKEFELVYSRDIFDNEYRYIDFNRMMDRTLSEQKSQIRELFSLGFEEKLVDIVKEKFNLDEIDDKYIVLKFKTDMKNIYDLQLGRYNN